MISDHQTFIINHDNKPQVNHIDANKLNNNVSNLEWVTFSENAKHMVEQGNSVDKNGTANPMSLLTEEQVLEIRSFDGSSTELAIKFGVSTNAIDRVRVGDSYKNVGGRILPKGYRNSTNAQAIHRKLTDAQVYSIRFSEQYINISNRQLAKIFNIGKSTIDCIKNFKTYKHVVL